MRTHTFVCVKVSGFEFVFVPVHVCGFPKQDGQNIGEFIGDSKSSDKTSKIQLNCRVLRDDLASQTLSSALQVSLSVLILKRG